jgi:mannosylglucosylglycerate synthase
MGAIVELNKWEAMYKAYGHEVISCRGKVDKGAAARLDREGQRLILLPELSSANPVHQEVMASLRPDITDDTVAYLYDIIEKEALRLAQAIQELVTSEKVDALHVDALTSYPINLPAARALQIIGEERVPVVLREHDFIWERIYRDDPFLESAADRFLPGPHGRALHITTTETARQSLLRRLPGENITVAPNLFRYSEKERLGDGTSLRKHLGLGDEDIMLFQPTRCVPTKGVHHTVHLAKRVREATGRRPVVVISGAGIGGSAANSSAPRYSAGVTDLATSLSVDLIRLDGTLVAFGSNPADATSMESAYAGADIVCFPSMVEGFGNPVVESALCEAPLMAAEYPVYIDEFAAKGFTAATMTPDPIELMRPGKYLFDLAEERVDDRCLEEVLRSIDATDGQSIARRENNKNLAIQHYGDDAANRERYITPVRKWLAANT